MDRRKGLRAVVHATIILYGLACLWLFYQQSVAVLSVEGESRYQSDLPLHISMVIEDGWYYSFTAFVYKALYVLFGGGTAGIAFFLSAVAVATVYATENFVYRLGKYGEKTWYTLLLSLGLNFVMPIYIRAVGEFRYVSYQSPNIWHNSTYLCMRLVALVTLTYYFKLEEKYRDGISWREWCAFALLNVVCTGVKPSFLLAFSPIMGIFLLADLLKKVPLRRILAFGSALLPSGLVILWQNAVLFGGDTGNGITFRPWYTFSLHTQIPKLAVVCSVLFCGLTVAVTCRQVLRERPYRFLVLMAILGFMEALCLVEEGRRSVDGNFLWGYSFCLFALFCMCSVKCLQLRNTKMQRILQIALGGIFALHLYCGLYFFIRLVSGIGFWMR